MSDQQTSSAPSNKPPTLLICTAVFVIALIIGIGMIYASTSGSRTAVAASGQASEIAALLTKVGTVEIAPAPPASSAEAAASAPDAAASASEAAASAPQAAASE